MFRILKWLFLIALVLAVATLFGLPLLANTEAGRKQLASSLGNALGREVRIGDLSVGLLFRSVRVDGLRISNPPGYPAVPFLEAGSIEFQIGLKQLIQGKIEGRAKGSRIHLLVQKTGGGTNLDGLGGDARARREKPEGERGPELDLALELDDCDVVVEDLDRKEKVTVQGVSARFALSNREGQSAASLGIHVASIDRGALRMRDVDVQAVQSGDWLDLEKLKARIGDEGGISGKGRLQVRNGDAWNVDVAASGVRIDTQILPIVATMFPLAGAASDQVQGSFEGNFALEGRGLTWQAAKPTLKGGGDLRLHGMGLPATSILAQLASHVGRAQGAIQLNDAGATFTVGNGWLDFSRLSASGEEARYDLAGRISLDGALELNLDVLPLMKRYGGGGLAKYTDKLRKLPVRIGGTTAKPKFDGLDVADVVKNLDAGSLLDDAIKRVGGGR